MPLNLPPALIEEKNKISSDSAWIILLRLSIDDGSEIYYFTNDNQDIEFQGNNYISFPFELDDNTVNNTGEIPTISLQISNINRVVQSTIEEYDGGINSTVDIIPVNTNHLTEDYDPVKLTFKIISTSADAKWVTFTLGTPNPLNQRFPLYKYLANNCKWVSNYMGAECNYPNEYNRHQLGRGENFNSASGWEVSGAMAVYKPQGHLLLAATTTDPTLTSPINYFYETMEGDNFNLVPMKVKRMAGNKFNLVRMKVKRISGTGWDGSLYYTTTTRGTFQEGYKKQIPDTTKLNEWVILDWDMTQLTNGGNEYITSIIDRLRFDLGSAIGDDFLIDWIKVIDSTEYLPTCKGTLEDCENHFNTKRFGGYPGLSQIGMRFV